MKYSVLLVTFICSFVFVQVFTWKMTYPETNVKTDFSRTPEKSLFGKSAINRQFQTFLTPTRSIQRPSSIRQRNIRDLMTHLVVNNHRTPPGHRQTAQRVIARPAPGMRTRETNFHHTYHKAYAMPSGTVLHSMNENPRAQTMVLRESTMRKVNHSPARRPQTTFQRASIRAPHLQTAQGLKEIRGMPASPSIYNPHQQNTALLDSAALKDILSSSTDTRLRSQKAPKRAVEVIHHIPMTMNPSKLKSGGSAVVYISKPSPDVQASQGMFMRNLPPASGQNKLTQNPSFVMRGHDSVYSTGNNLKDRATGLKNGLQNPNFASNSKAFQKQTQVPYLAPATGIREKFVTNGFKNHHNAALTSVMKNVPQPHVSRDVTSNGNMKQGISESFNMPLRPTQNNNIPRINRLKQELNAEIEQLLKLVPQQPVPVTKKPKLMIQQQIPHPFLIPSPEFAGNTNTNKQIKSFSPGVSRNIPRHQQLAVNSAQEIQQPHVVPFNTKDDFLKMHSLKDMKMPNMPDILSSTHRRPVVSESTVDSEELAEILESIGYPGKSKVIHNMAGKEPVRLIISDQSEEMKHIANSSSNVMHLPSHHSGYTHTQNTEILSPYNDEYIQANGTEILSPYSEGMHPSKTENLPHINEDIHPSETEILSPYNNEDTNLPETENLSPYNNKDTNLPETENLSPYNNEDTNLPETENLSPHNGEGIHPPTTENLSHYYSEDIHPLTTENLSPYYNGDVRPLTNEDLSSGSLHFSDSSGSSLSKIEDLTPSNTGVETHTGTHTGTKESSKERLKESDLTLFNNDELHENKSSLVKTYWDFRTDSIETQTSSALTTTEASSVKLNPNEKELPFRHSANNYQGEESIASISVKEEFPMEEEVKKKFRLKQENLKFNQGTLHDVYKKIHNKNTETIPPSHRVRYFPQRLHSSEAGISPTPVVINKVILPDTTTKSYEHNERTKYSDPHVSQAKVTNFAKHLHKDTANSFSPLNRKENPTSQKPTVLPNHSTTNNIFNNRPFRRPSTPRYVITKTPHRQPYYSNRNKQRNENSLIPKYMVPERQHFENQPLNNSEYINSEVIRKPPTHSNGHNFGFRQLTTDATPLTQSSFTSDISDYSAFVKESRLKYADAIDFTTTTDIPEETTYSSFETGTAESQVENTQEVENGENEFNIPQIPETSTTINKQFFRGPQHSIVYDDFTTNSFHEPTTDFMPDVSSETTVTPTTVPEINPFTQYNEPGVRQHSVYSQTKVINTMHLANKVFGRRNHTSFKQPVSTTKLPLLRHKFTYSPVVKSSTKHPTTQPESTTSRRVVFNFRTGTTHSIPIRTSSAAPKIFYGHMNRSKLIPKLRNESLDFISDITEEDRIISSSSPRKVFHHIVFSQPNISSKSPNHTAVTETNKDLYGILKPITKPYNSSLTTFAENELNKSATKSFKVHISSTTIKPTSPISAFPSLKDIEEPSTLDSENSSSTETILPITSSIKNINTGEITETTEPFTDFYTTEVQTETTSINEVPKTESNLEMNVTIASNPTEITTEPIHQEQVIVESLKSMKLKMQDMASKGLRHLMPLVMELSSDVSISSDCTFSLLRWLRAVRTMEQWAVRMMDASSKIPEGILYGTFSTFGSYDECVAIKTPKVNLQMPYSGQYCSINIQPVLPPSERHFTIQNAFRKYPKLKQVFQEMNIEEDTMAYYYILKHRIGLCMPSTCSIEDLGNVTEKLADELKMKISVERCETSEKPSLTRGQIISMCCVFITFGVVILATIIDLSMRVRSDHEMDIDEIIRKKNGIRQFSYVFSAFGNARKILDTSIPTTHLSSLHGIKFLSITWVMLGHVYYCKDYLTLAGLNKVRDLGSNLAFQVVLNSAYGADTFFFLSGLLVVYSTFLYLENNNGHFTIVGFYIRRYWRLTPAFLMISGVILLGPLAGSGPIWHETLEPFVSGCQNYWWTNLFYFSNFMPTDKTCVPHGWFLSCDMQFYIVSPIIILALYRRPKLGILLIILGILSSMVTTGFLTFLYNLPPVSLFSLPDPKDINEYLDTIGYKPYAHYASYCIGMATGFLLAAKQKISISKCLQIFGWVASIIGCLLVIYGTWDWNSGELPDWPVSVAYATTSRTVWCLGVAWLTVVCYAGHGGPVNSILSWHGFIPLSRLSYLAYLIHPLLMYLYASYVRSPFYFSQYVVVYLYLGHLCVTFGLAFLFSLAFEVPFLNLEKVITKYLDKSKRKRRASFSNHHNNWQHPEHPELKDSVVLMRRRADKFLS